MQTATFDEVQTHFSDVLQKLSISDEVVITRNGIAVAKLVPPPREKPRPQFGSGRDTLVYYVDDDEHLKDFEEYMP